MTEPEVMPAVAPPLSAQEFKFVDAYCQCRDVGKSAIEAGFPSRLGMALYRRKGVHAEIEARMKNITSETDKLVAKKRIVNVETLDRALMAVVAIPRKILLETPSLATPKVNAIELGYRRTGLLIDDNFVPDAGSAAAQDEVPRIYRPAGATIITHRVTEVHEVSQTLREAVRAITTPRESNPEPPTIEADAGWDKF